MDNPINDNEMSLKDFIEDEMYIAPEEYAEQSVMKADLEKVLNTLNADEADIIRWHYGLGRQEMSLNEIV